MYICIIRFWERATCENVPIVEYWDQRIRRSLKTRYDYREGVFDWDYHMILKSRGISNLTLQEYRYIFINSKIFMKFYHINIFLLFNYLI